MTKYIIRVRYDSVLEHKLQGTIFETEVNAMPSKMEQDKISVNSTLYEISKQKYRFKSYGEVPEIILEVFVKSDN